MKARFMPLGGMLLAAVALTSAQENGKPELHKNPKAALDALFEASSKQDFKALVACFVPEVQMVMASQFARDGLLARQEVEGKLFKDRKETKKDEKLAKKYEPILAVMKKYNLTEAATKDIDLRVFQLSAKDRETVLKLIKKPDAFTVEMMTAINEVTPFPKRVKPKYTLVDLKMAGDRATAKIRDDSNEKDPSPQMTPVEFVKIDGGWRVNPNPPREEPKKDTTKPKDKKKE